MRHRKKNKTLSRKDGARTALMRSLATSLVLYEKIKTTEAKARVLRPYVEKMITLGKKNTLHARRQLLAKLYIESAVKKVLDELSPRMKDRKGGYLRIIKLGKRQGDGAEMVRIEFVESVAPVKATTVKTEKKAVKTKIVKPKAVKTATKPKVKK